MSFDTYYAHYEAQLTDFWERRKNVSKFCRTFTVFGRQIELSTNEEQALMAVDFSQPLYSAAPVVEGNVFKIHIIVRPFPVSPGPLPSNLFDHIQYSGHAHWMAMQFGGWGHCQIDLAEGEALAVLSSEFGSQPESISRYLLNTTLNNFIHSQGLGLLHTTAVYRDEQILMMMADHNSGKSTTALHLTLAGYNFVSDSQIYIEQGAAGLSLYAFPVGRVKLRQDMLAKFPRLETYLESEPVRRETKFRLDLQLVAPQFVHDRMIVPKKIHLCLLSRNGRVKSDLSRASKEEVLESAMMNSLYYDSSDVWQKNFEHLEQLIRQAECYHLAVGTDVDDIIRVVDEMMS